MTTIVPWHEIGIQSNGVEPSDEVLNKVWKKDEYALQPIHTQIEGVPIRIPKKYALHRKGDKKVLKIVGENYLSIEKLRHSFSRIGEISNRLDLDSSSTRLGKFGQFGKVWSVIKIPNLGFYLYEDDKVECYLLFTISPTNFNNIEIRFIALRLVCSNGMTSTILNIVVESTEINGRFILNIKNQINKGINGYELGAKFLLRHKYKDRDVLTYLTELFGLNQVGSKILSKEGEMVFESIENQPGSSAGEKSWWNVFNAVTHHLDHEISYTEEHINKTWFGVYRNLKSRAFRRAIAYIRVDGNFKDEELSDEAADYIYL